MSLPQLMLAQPVAPSVAPARSQATASSSQSTHADRAASFDSKFKEQLRTPERSPARVDKPAHKQPGASQQEGGSTDLAAVSSENAVTEKTSTDALLTAFALMGGAELSTPIIVDDPTVPALTGAVAGVAQAAESVAATAALEAQADLPSAVAALPMTAPTGHTGASTTGELAGAAAIVTPPVSALTSNPQSAGTGTQQNSGQPNPTPFVLADTHAPEPSVLAAVLDALAHDVPDNPANASQANGLGLAAQTPTESSALEPGAVRTATSQVGAIQPSAPQLDTASTQAARPAQPVPANTPAGMLDQVRGPIGRLVQAPQGNHTFTVNVTPENLGPVTVRAHIGAEGIRVELIGATDAARDSLRAIMTDLKRDLQSTGMNAQLNLSNDSGNSAFGNNTGNEFGSGQRGLRPPGATAPAVAHDAESHTAQPEPTTHDATGVDILA